MPPPTAPTTSAVRPTLARVEPGVVEGLAGGGQREAIGARVRRREPPAASGTSPASPHRKPVASKSVSGRIAQAPAARPAQYALTPAPNGLTTPSPVTTIRLMRRRAVPR